MLSYEHYAQRELVTYPSQDGSSPITAAIWTPTDLSLAAAPKGIVQIAHGMAEHIGRYGDLAGWLAKNGYVVCANDHVGHGRSVADQSEWGCMPIENGCRILVEDAHMLRTLVLERYDNTPYFLFGHSMGSFVARAYLARHAEGLNGAIICGTGYVARVVCQMGELMAKHIARSQGADHYSKLLNSMADGAYAKAIDHPRTGLDWLSTDEDVVDRYISDNMSGFPFKASGYATLMDLCTTVNDQSCANAIPRDLPLLLIAGAEDPVGNNGKGVQTVARMYEKAGVTDLTTKIYPGMRHEIHNEPGWAEVYRDLVNWMEERL